MVVTHAGFSSLVPRNGNESHNASAPIYSRLLVYSSPVRVPVGGTRQDGNPAAHEAWIPAAACPRKSKGGNASEECGSPAAIRSGRLDSR